MNETVTLLIVDDSPVNLKVLSHLLKEYGYKIALAMDGDTAFKILSDNKIDLILLDIMMPEMDGYEVCRKLKDIHQYKDIPVIFISALNDTRDIVKAFDAGGVDYITKPFQAEEVKARVATHIKISQQNIELQKLNTDKDRFISILAHDLRNPLNSIILLSERLTKNIRKFDTDKIENMVTVVNKSTHHLHRLLEDILLWARTQSGKLPFAPSQIQLSLICDDVKENMELSANEKKISIGNFISSEIMITADVDMLSAILRNLISNAIKFTHTGGQIKIAAEKMNMDMIITVSDNGIGMKPEMIHNLFDFTKIQSTKGTAEEKGTGFGLLLCKEFVDKHGGKIWAEGELGIGSNFKFTIPL